ncbi:MAG: hypothetical protein ABIS07_07110 [Dokdonella sp.]
MDKTAKPQPPEYWIPCTQAGFAIYGAVDAIGFQFVDNAGKTVFVSLPGKLLYEIAQQAVAMMETHPESMSYKPVVAKQTKPH